MVVPEIVLLLRATLAGDYANEADLERELLRRLMTLEFPALTSNPRWAKANPETYLGPENAGYFADYWKAGLQHAKEMVRGSRQEVSNGVVL